MIFFQNVCWTLNTKNKSVWVPFEMNTRFFKMKITLMRQIEEYLAKREKVFLVLSSFVVQCMMKANVTTTVAKLNPVYMHSLLTIDFQEDDDQQRLSKRKEQKQKDSDDETKASCSLAHEESLTQLSNEEVKQLSSSKQLQVLLHSSG